MQIEIDEAVLRVLFPAFLILDGLGRIREFGPTIARRFPRIATGDRIETHFTITGGAPDGDLSALVDSSQTFTLVGHVDEARLVGMVLRCSGGLLLTLRMSPESFLLDSSDYTMADFAPGDPAIHGLLLLSMQRALLDEQRTVVRELAKERQNSVDLLDRVSRVAGFMAHDFNNFLSIIKLTSDRMRIELRDQPRLRRMLDIIKSTAARGSAITRSLMTLSHQRDDTRILVAIDDMIRDNIQFFSTIAGTDVQIKVELAAPGLVAEVSPVGALNSLVNLLMNARDAMPEGGLVTIRTQVRKLPAGAVGGSHEPGDCISIEVADTGKGMEPEVLSKAFKPLFSTKPSGNGLGLASVLDFAREAGGDACIDSAPGRGTEVHILLPARIAPDVAVAREPGLGGPHAGSALAPTILLVDDEPYAIEALAELLEAEGYAVTACESCAQALVELASKPFRVLLTDIVMPGENGTALAEAACRMQPGLKVILMSGFVPEGQSMAADWMFLRKPIDTAILTSMLRLALDGPVAAE